jgi:hypothetical protein
VTIRILTIRQPWASLIMLGLKDIENRSWATSHRGPLAIHAAAKCTADWSPLIDDLLTRDDVNALPRGVILGVVTLTECVTAHSSRWFEGPVGWCVERPRVFRSPILHRGQLALAYPSHELLQRLEAALATSERVRPVDQDGGIHRRLWA